MDKLVLGGGEGVRGGEGGAVRVGAAHIEVEAPGVARGGGRGGGDRAGRADFEAEANGSEGAVPGEVGEGGVVDGVADGKGEIGALGVDGLSGRSSNS